MVEIQVPYLYNNSADHARLSQLVEAVIALDPCDVTLKFENCGFLMSNAVVVLGGLRRLVAHRGGKLELDLQSLREPVAKNLGRSGFLAAHGGQKYPWRDNAIPYREYSIWSALEVVDYLETDWLGRNWPIGLSAELRAAIVSRVVEVYLNAFEHAFSPVGVISCGQYYPRVRRLQLSVADFGVGIPTRAREYIQRTGVNELADDASCLEWAFRRGTSTNPMGMGRGLGLDLLREFIVANDGNLKVYSKAGFVEITGGGASFRPLKHPFPGTLIDLEIRCDEKFYKVERAGNGMVAKVAVE